ncbi:PLP-dependent transferase [Didymella exigua CBS 183.55]|uniref:PLP-dependent transferase n=1 Tax=Didymella exigua CBS 183.55 TaxID=1150837 RepID=A0A6A5S1C4_9PLEO|nr:PLP-dependent transferase [Didymella exigua CBS 183.55]KAF1933589.1 PLP-dependent transferase [Didymella exigua CBS 183.55]
MALSPRGHANAAQLSIPWRFAKPHTYDPITNPRGLISFATAENCLFQRELHDFVAEVPIPQAALRYAFGTGGGSRLPSAFAAHIHEYFAPHELVRGEDVKITAAATGLHDVLAFSLCAEGEGVLTSRPYYGRFEIDFGNKSGVRLVPVDTDHEDCFETGVVNAFERKLEECERQNISIRAVLVVNPHNPLGRCYTRETLIELMRFCQRRGLHLISDEIYALSVFENPDAPDATCFTSALSISPTDVINPDLVHVIYGLSKDFGLAGLKIGCLVSRNEQLKKAVTAVQRFCGVSGLSVAVATQMLEDRDWVRSIVGVSKRRLAQAYAFITRRLKVMGVKFFEGGNAGFFLWIDLTPWLPPVNSETGGATRAAKCSQKDLYHHQI